MNRTLRNEEKCVIKVAITSMKKAGKVGENVITSERSVQEKQTSEKGFTTLHFFQNERFSFSFFPFPFMFPKSLAELIENLDLGSNSKSIKSPSCRVGILGSGAFLGAPVIWE
jgi:hypothetical protein